MVMLCERTRGEGRWYKGIVVEAFPTLDEYSLRSAHTGKFVMNEAADGPRQFCYGDLRPTGEWRSDEVAEYLDVTPELLKYLRGPHQWGDRHDGRQRGSVELTPAETNIAVGPGKRPEVIQALLTVQARCERLDLSPAPGALPPDPNQGQAARVAPTRPVRGFQSDEQPAKAEAEEAVFAGESEKEPGGPADPQRDERGEEPAAEAEESEASAPESQGGTEECGAEEAAPGPKDVRLPAGWIQTQSSDTSELQGAISFWNIHTEQTSPTMPTEETSRSPKL